MKHISQLCFFLVIATGMPSVLRHALPHESSLHIWAWVFAFISGALTAMLLELITDLVHGNDPKDKDGDGDLDD